MNEPDGSLGGYLEKHGRPPAFEGPDGSFYSVDIFQDDEGASLMFVRWSDDGAQPVGHVESPVLVRASNTSDPRAGVLALSLVDVKRELDRAIAERSTLPDW